MKALKIILRIVFWCSIACIVASIGLYIFLETRGHNIEFINHGTESRLYSLVVLGIFFGIPLTLTGTLRNADGFLSVAGRIAGTIFLMFVVYLFFIFTALSGMCRYSREEVLYENKLNPDLHIVIRSFGCGAVDSEPATPHVFTEETKWNYFYVYEEADTSHLSESEWKPVR